MVSTLERTRTYSGTVNELVIVSLDLAEESAGDGWLEQGRGKVVFGKFFQKMLANGVYLAPSQFEAGFISITHTDTIIEKTLEAVMETFRLW